MIGCLANPLNLKPSNLLFSLPAAFHEYSAFADELEMDNANREKLKIHFPLQKIIQGV
jgi:hypothetical protein